MDEYIVEMLDQSSPDWKHVVSVPAGSLELRAAIFGLNAGEQYEFRVIARKNAHKGEPSEPSDKITAKDRNGCFLYLLGGWTVRDGARIF